MGLSNRLTLILSTLLSLSFLLNRPVSGAEQLARLIAGVSKTHPRLFLHDSELAGLRQKISGDSLLDKTFSIIRIASDESKEKKPVERIKVGRRLLGVSRDCLQRVNQNAFVYRVTGEKSYLEVARREMLAAANFEDWNPSHFLDVAEMTAALAIGYDWLFNSLCAEDRHLIKAAIVEKGLQPSLQGNHSWITATSNWNQVCHGGLVLGALAVLEDEPELAARIIERAIEHIPLAMRGYAPDGAYPEGPVYWGYGTTYNVLMIAALESVFGTDFDLTKSEGFLESAEFIVQATGPTGKFFNYSDCGLTMGLAPALYWFSSRLNKPAILWQAKSNLQKLAAGSGESTGRFLPFLLIWTDRLDNVTAPETLHWLGRGETPVAFHRSGWDKEATFVATKGGSPSTSHAHMDIGTFVMDALGVRWASDFGPQNYNQLETYGIDLWNRRQDGGRWTVFRLNNRSHNTLVVNDQLQQVKGHSDIIEFSNDGPTPHTIVDMSPVYDGQLSTAVRGIMLREDGSVLVQDEIEAVDKAASIRWGMVTRTNVEILGPTTAILRQDGRELGLTVLHPKNIQLMICNTAEPPHEYDAKNEGSCMIGFETSLRPKVKERLVVLLNPGGDPNQLPDILPLAAWSRQAEVK